MERQAAIKQNITINAPASKVWAMFNNPKLTRQMGGEYVSDWKEGSSFGWKGLNGQLLTNGKILKIEKNVILMHSLFYPDINDGIMAIITYSLHEHNGQTTVSIKEDFTNPITDEEKAAAEQGWIAALTMAKQLLEK